MTLPMLMLPAAMILAAAAQAPAPVRTLDAASAQSIIEGCRVQAQQAHKSHGIAIVDVGGHPVALLRMDGNPPGVMAFAEGKARAAALWGFATGDMEQAG